MNHQVYDVLVEGIRALFLIVVPMTVGVSIAGIVVALLQAMTSINDVATGYGVRLVGLIVVLYLFLASFADTVMLLAVKSFG